MATPHKDFHHPYQPYDIQYGLMNAIYDCIANRKVGIFESPTDFQEHELQGQFELNDGEDELDWVLEHSRNERRRIAIEQRQREEARLAKIRVREARQKQRSEIGEPKAKRTKMDEGTTIANSDDDNRFLLEDYESDVEKKPEKNDYISAASLTLMEELGEFVYSTDKDLLPEDKSKIFYCSRTHSQLAQFVQELGRVKLPTGSWAIDVQSDQDPKDHGHAVIKHLPLASRKNLCINPKVARLGNATAINERCLELQQPDTSKDNKCPFVPNSENETLVNDFRDRTLAQIRDIEDIGNVGKTIGICPYYASRAAIKPSEIVTLPYPLLLQKSAREALGISLKDHTLIIDEAHNLMDAISNINSVAVTHAQLKRSKALLNIYLQKFRNKLKGKNRTYVVQVVRVIDSLLLFLDHKAKETHSSEGLVNVSDLTAGKGVDQVNLHKLMQYLGESKLARKVEGYADYLDKQEAASASESQAKATPVLMAVQAFFGSLTNPASEGRFFSEKTESGDLLLKYMLLDPSEHFREAVEEARSLILAGGTMSPMEDYVRHLFPYLDADRIQTWSCGHIIPKENLIVLPVAKGPSDVTFDFTFEKRNSPAMIATLGNAIIQLCTSIPDGTVVFFPSYRYLDDVIIAWKKRQQTFTIWDRLTTLKPTFTESKSTSNVSDILNAYTASITADKGGLLLSVIGGKMSEGINFSDRLGRCVIVVGLPFPNIQSATWKAKLEYIEQSMIGRGGNRDAGKAAARDFYENACMRAVNQSIGRAIRHKGDYASIVLLDRRYGTPRIEGKLPGWIRQGLVRGERERAFGDVIGDLRGFFKAKG